VSGTVTSQAMGFPLAHGRRVVPSGRLLSLRIRLAGSLTAGIGTRLIALHSDDDDDVAWSVRFCSRIAHEVHVHPLL